MDTGWAWIGRSAWWVGLVLHLLVGWLYWASPLLAPVWVLALLLPVWGVLLWFQIRWRRRRPWAGFLIPAVALGIWWGVLTLGERLWGWTA